MSLIRKIAFWWREFFRRRRLSLQNATDNVEEWHVHLSPAGALSALVAFTLVLFILILAFTAYTPVLEFLPGYRTQANRSKESLVASIMRIDSMERMMNDMLVYNNNIALIMEGKTPVVPFQPGNDTTRLSKQLVLPDRADSALRAQMEGDGPYALSRTTTRRSVREAMEMTPPIEGIITRRFDPREEHFGIGIAAPTQSQVSAIDNGTVVLSLWTPAAGSLVAVQHAGQLLSIYRNLSQSLVSPGQIVKTGEIIAISSDVSRETGDQGLFEFELWSNGKPVDPEAYIVF